MLGYLAYPLPGRTAPEGWYTQGQPISHGHKQPFTRAEVATKTVEARFRGKTGDYVVVRYHHVFAEDKYYVKTPGGRTRGSFSRDRAFEVARDLAERSRR